MANPSEYNTTVNKQDDEKWKIFTPALKKVQMQVHPNLMVSDEALQYIEQHIIDLLHTLCNVRPNSTQDVIEQVAKTFPKPIDRWAIQDATLALKKKSNKKGEKGVTLPADKVHPLLKEQLGYKLDQQVTLCLMAVLEYVAADILKLVGNYVRNISGKEITKQDVRVTMCADKVLNKMFFSNDSDSETPTRRQEEKPPPRLSSVEDTQTYEDVLKDLIVCEQQHIRELELIIKVFRTPFVELFPNSKDIDVIFSNILDVHSFSLDLLGALEDTVEITEQNQMPLVGGCFEEMAEGAEFDVYEKYVEDVVKPQLRDRLDALLIRTDLTAKLNSYDQSFKDVVKYLLPKLLQSPLYHLHHRFDVMDKLMESDQSTEEDKESLSQAIGLLRNMRRLVERKINQLQNSSPAIKRKALGPFHIADRAVMAEKQKSIENWEGKDIDQLCNDFIMEGTLFVHQNRRDRKERERFVFLFDNMILMCKHTGRKNNASPEYRFKEKHLLRNIDVIDCDDTEEVKRAFELQEQSQQTSLVLSARTSQEKNDWMAALISLIFRSNLDRMLDSKLQEEESRLTLVLPLVEEYPFSEEDSEDNLVLEESQTPGEPPLIQGATLNKLVERLTYHEYADPRFVRRFLTTYRSFCSPKELLDLLIRRFQIPESNVYADNREAYSRFKKEYVKPVQFRVLNVIRHWVDHHFYDFEREEKLLTELNVFLDTIKGKIMRKWVDSILNILKRKVETSLKFQGILPDANINAKSSLVQFNESAPNPEWFVATQDEIEKFSIMTLHPIEVARQETLIEFSLYRAVKPSELVGSVFTKKDKEKTCPNLMKLIHQTNRFIYWLETSLLNTKNLEERIAVLCRIIEIMTVFRELNNFNGVLCVVSALDCAPVHRLSCTFENLKYKKKLEEAKDLLANHFKKYFEILRAIDPPCVPFFGVYMTNILKLEEGNPDCLPNTDLINFTKRRKVADITAEIQQYQNQPYNLAVVQPIQDYLLNLDPWEGRNENELEQYLYDLSLEIEPRNMKPPPKFPRRFDSVCIKSPGIKPTSRQTLATAFRSHLPSISGSSEIPNRFVFSSKTAMDDDDNNSMQSINSSTVSSPPTTPNTPITPPLSSGESYRSGSPAPSTPPPRTPPPNKKNTPPRMSLYSDYSFVESQASVFSNTSNITVISNQSWEERDTLELQPPPLPPRVRAQFHHSYPLEPPREPPPQLPPKMPNRSDRDIMEHPPRLPPRPSRSMRMIERSGSMPSSEHRYSRRNSGDHVNVNGVAPGTPQLPPRTYKPNHGRQRSQ